MEQSSNDGTQILPTVKKYGPLGTTTGREREIDYYTVDKIVRIVTIRVYHEKVIHNIFVSCELFDGKDTFYSIGGFKGKLTEINFMPDEYITCVRGCIGLLWGNKYVKSIEITTNYDVYGPIGNPNDHLYPFEFRGGKIIGFHGRSAGIFVDAIGVYVKGGETLHQQYEEHLRHQLAQEARLRQQSEQRLAQESLIRQQAEQRLAHETRIRQQAEQRLAQETRIRQQAEENYRNVCNENKALTRMGKEHEKFRYWIEQANSSDSYVNAMFTWFKPSELPTNDSGQDFLGSGGYGNVYKAVIDGTEVAIKVPKLGQRSGRELQFNPEVAILGKIRHPNLVTLIGACQEQYALVYEYLPNGSLENRLTQSRRDTEVLPWSERTKIAASICSALVFLHNTKPHPIAHGDLKPENILFDSNNECKLSDFGISRFLKNVTTMGTPMHETRPKGTDDYIDPEFEETRRLTPQSDVYAFGIILLQLVTGEDADHLRKRVLGKIEGLENFMEKNQLQQREILEGFPDAKSVGWPIDEAVKMTSLGIRCSDPKRKNRPNLEKVVWVEIVNGFASVDS